MVQLSFTIVAITYPLGHIPLPLVAKVLLLLNLQCHGILTLRGLVCLLILFRLPSSWSRTCGCFEEQLWSFQVQAVSAFSEMKHSIIIIFSYSACVSLTFTCTHTHTCTCTHTHTLPHTHTHTPPPPHTYTLTHAPTTPAHTSMYTVSSGGSFTPFCLGNETTVPSWQQVCT